MRILEKHKVNRSHTKITPDTFQLEAVNKLVDRVIDLINHSRDNPEIKGRNIVLDSSVGSGKTVMSMLTMDQLASLEEDIVFFWLSPGAGGLAKQSQLSISSMSERLNTMDIETAINGSSVNSGDAIFSNWEKISGKDRVLNRKNERGKNLESLIKKSKGKDIVLFIDESHIASQTVYSQEVVEIIDPTVIINISATPDKSIVIDKQLDVISVDLKDVIDSGRVKSKLVINDNLQNHMKFNRSLKENILSAAIEKQKELEKLYSENKLNKKPLILIQIGNDKFSGDNRINSTELKEYKEIERILIDEFGYEEDDIAIWLSNSSSSNPSRNHKDLDNNDVKFLIFKQAIATGWDCPRSHILVRFRDVKSIVFDIQTVGRIMRSINGVSYPQQQMNMAYVYTDSEDYEMEFSKNVYNSGFVVPPMETELRSDAPIELKNLVIPKETINTHLEYKTSTKDLTKLIEEKMGDINSLEIKYDKLSRKILSLNAKFENLDEFAQEVEAIHNLSFNEKEDIFNKYFYEIYEKYNLSDFMYELLSQHKLWDESDDFIYNLFISNEVYISEVIKEAINETEDRISTKIVVQSSYTVPKKAYYSEVVPGGSKYLYESKPTYMDANSASEMPFSQYLDSSSEVKTWFKNGLGDDAFSLVYYFNDLPQRYFPDFIFLDNDNNLYIVDVKAPFGSSDYPNVDLKHFRQKEYEEYINKNLPDGIKSITLSMVKLFRGNPYILSTSTYNDKITSGDWLELSEVLGE